MLSLCSSGSECERAAAVAAAVAAAWCRRFNKIAVRNWDRMKATANQAYSMTVKPLVDRLSGDQQGQ